ncbi:MAG: hypothetical protein JW768_09635 [Chitinispirillaceae bacterium]|nr:hypothetical protein [Chitinispirillaceae bacterium]
MKNKAGMTLIEGLITAAVAVVIGTVMVTVIYFNGDQVKSSALNAKLLQQYETVVSQISQTTRGSNAVLEMGETWHSSTFSFPQSTTQSFQVYDASGNRIGGFLIDGTTLKEWSTSVNNWVPFVINPSDGPVQVTINPPSNFILAPNRKYVTLNLNIVASYLSQKDTVFSGQEVFSCRN